MTMLDRRRFLGVLLATAATPLLARAAGDAAPKQALTAALETSPLVYVSPLKKNGQESTCHGEVWFAWIDGSAVIITATDRWKAKSIASGLDRARLWVGDQGPWKKLVGRNEDFRKAPSVDAKARFVKDPAVLEKLIQVYEKKYPAEIGSWVPKFRAGFASGDRVLIAYQPIGA
jgi:hypothetical protein